MSSKTVHSTGDSCASMKILIIHVCQLTPTPTHPPHFLSHSHIYNGQFHFLSNQLLASMVRSKPWRCRFIRIDKKNALLRQNSITFIYGIWMVNIVAFMSTITFRYDCINNYLFRKYFIYYSLKIVINLISI